MPRVRADVLLVQRGLAETRERAQRLIMAGQARSGTTILVKPATLLDEGAPLTLAATERFVSRGGHKLQAALDAWNIDLAGRHCLDLGASTGGFTDCMLQAGAHSVLAVDVGRSQLHSRLRDDRRVTLLEGTNARDLPALPSGISFFAADLSFISLRKVAPSVAARLAPGTEGVFLFKPQFEATPADIPRGGVIRDAALRKRLLAGFVEAIPWTVLATMECPLPGGDGNVEYLVHVRTPALTPQPPLPTLRERGSDRADPPRGGSRQDQNLPQRPEDGGDAGTAAPSAHGRFPLPRSVGRGGQGVRA